MAKQRVARLNSLLKEVISDVIRKDVRNPRVNELVTITRVEITNDLRHAKVFVSVIGPTATKNETVSALKSGSGFISSQASKQVKMRFFPSLSFKLDDSVDKHMRIESLLYQITEERNARPESEETL